VPASVTYSGVTAILHPTTSLAANTSYTGILAAGITDLSGNQLGTDYTWNFTTENIPNGWWRGSWPFQQSLTINNPNASALAIHYSVMAAVDTGTLIANGQLLANCSDLRVVYFDGIASCQLDRVVYNCGTTNTQVWFALQRPRRNT